MSDSATIERQIRTEFPNPPGFPVRVSKEDRFVTGADYEAMLADRVALAVEGETRKIAEIEQRTRRQQFIVGMTALRADYVKLDDETQTVSQLEFRRMLKRVNRGVTFLGEILQDLGQVERE